MHTENRPDEWKIEQGLSGAKLPILDQTGPETITIQPREWEEDPRMKQLSRLLVILTSCLPGNLKVGKGTLCCSESASCSDRAYASANMPSATWNGRSILKRRQRPTRYSLHRTFHQTQSSRWDQSLTQTLCSLAPTGRCGTTLSAVN